MRKWLVALVIVVSIPLAAQSKRPLQSDDIFELKTVADPRISADGAWVAYTVSQMDRKDDSSDTDIYMNVPIIGGQQLYQGLKRLGRDTELIVYPGENHGIRRPSFQKDRYDRYIAWYERYLKAPATKTSAQ